MYNPIKTPWFWFLIIGIILLIVFIVSYEMEGSLSDRSDTTAWWIWLVGIIGFIFFITSFLLFAVWKHAFSQSVKCCKKKLAKKCGDSDESPEFDEGDQADNCFYHPCTGTKISECEKLVKRRRW